MLRKIWQHDLIRFLTFRIAFGPMQFLVIAAVLGIFLGNIDTFARGNLAFIGLSIWLSLCLQSARLKDARVTRWLLLFTFLMPGLIPTIMPAVFSAWVNISPKSFAHLVIFEREYLIPMQATMDEMFLWIWLILYLLFLLFVPSRLKSDKIMVTGDFV